MSQKSQTKKQPRIARQPSRSLKSEAYRLAVFAALFVAGALVSFLFWSKISLPFSNPNGIVGTLADLKFNPSNNKIRFAFFASMPAVALFVFYLLSSKYARREHFAKPTTDADFASTVPLASKPLPWLLTAAFFLILALNTQTYQSVDRFDTFEEGLVMAAGVSYESGQVPFRDFLFFHGLYDEPIRALAAFKIFGKSIGAVRTFNSINKLVLFAFLLAFLALLFRKNYLYVLASALFLYYLEPERKFSPVTHMGVSWLNCIMLIPRDIAVYAFLVSALCIERFIRERWVSLRGLAAVAFIFSAAPLLGYIHSMDRGVYLVVALFITWPLVYFLFLRESPAGRVFVASSAAGFIASFALLAVLIRGAFPELLQVMTFLTSPDIDLQWSYVFDFAKPPYLTACLLIAFNIFWVARCFLSELSSAESLREGFPRFLRNYFAEFCLLVLSVFLFRNALGRVDWVHVGYVLAPSWILFLYICIKNVVHPLAERFAGFRLSLFFGIAAFCVFQAFLLTGRIVEKDLWNKNFPIKTPDASYIAAEHRQVSDYLRSRLSTDESFFSMTGDVAWYYFVDRPCPVRFSLTPMLARNVFYENQVIEDLERNNVKYIIDGGRKAYENDGYGNEARAPLVSDYIKKNYSLEASVSGYSILKRNG